MWVWCQSVNNGDETRWTTKIKTTAILQTCTKTQVFAVMTCVQEMICACAMEFSPQELHNDFTFHRQNVVSNNAFEHSMAKDALLKCDDDWLWQKTRSHLCRPRFLCLRILHCGRGMNFLPNASRCDKWHWMHNVITDCKKWMRDNEQFDDFQWTLRPKQKLESCEIIKTNTQEIILSKNEPTQNPVWW